MSFREEFPDYPVDAFPPMPAFFIDTSWHNDACPSIASEAGLSIWIDYPDPEQREMPDTKRFSVSATDADGAVVGEPLLETDEWSDVVAFLAARG